MSTTITNDAADEFNEAAGVQRKLMAARIIADACRRGARLSAKAVRALADGFALCDSERAAAVRGEQP